MSLLENNKEKNNYSKKNIAQYIALLINKSIR